MTSGAVTIENAPRDVEKLQVIGPFMLKRLMEQASSKLGIDFGEERKGAFLRDPIDKRAKDVLELLAQIDKSGGGAPAAAAETKAAAPAAETKAEDKPKREPVTKKGSSNGAANGTANGAAAPSEQDGIAILQGISSVLKGVSDTLESMQKAVANVEKGSKRMDSFEAKLEQVMKMQHLTLAVLAQLAENQLGANFGEILEGATGDYEKHEKAVEGLVSGK